MSPPPSDKILPQLEGSYKEVIKVEIKINGTPKEIADLVLEIQGRQAPEFVPDDGAQKHTAGINQKSAY